MGIPKRNVIWLIAIVTTISAAQADITTIDSLDFTAIIPPKDSSKNWAISGSVNYLGELHYIRTRTNHGENFIINNDTIKHGARYKNYYQAPGFSTMGSAYVHAESLDGKIIEFNADITSDHWNKFYSNPISLYYADSYHKVFLGDIQKSEGNLYMSDLPLFGIDYTLSLLKNKANESNLQFNAFFGEAVRPLLPRDKHPYLYNNYIEEGEAEAQRLAYGGSIKYTPLQDLNIALGGIYVNDEIEDPLLRDGASANTLTINPLQESFTLFADANYKLSKHLDMNVQLAIGRADTTDVIRERSINQVFFKAGIDNAKFSTLRSIMGNENKINTLTKEQLEEIFGDNTLLTKHKMQDSLRSLIKLAKNVQKETESSRDDDRALGLDWGNQNMAFAINGNFEYKETSINAYIKYIGENYYSAGSPDQISDTRELGISLHQSFLNAWDFDLNYALLIENAAMGNKTNLFGFGEGTRHGLFPNTSSNWYKEHERDIDRTRYTQNAGIENSIQLDKDAQLHFGYGIEYKQQYRPYQLSAVFTETSKVYTDKYFTPREGKPTTKYDTGERTIEIDKERWNAYKALAYEDIIASKFQERLYKHTWDIGFCLHKNMTTLKADGIFTWNLDASKFLNDSLVKDFDFSNETWGALGYYYGGINYFEQSYPIVATTKAGWFQNRFSISPRFKTYSRENLEESEVNVTDELEIPFMDSFFIFTLGGDFTYTITTWNEKNHDYKEKELDLIGDIRFRINHSKQFYSEYFFVTGFHYRPENLSNEYKDISGGFNLNYTF